MTCKEILPCTEVWSVKQITFWYGIKAEKSYCLMQSSAQGKKYKEIYSLCYWVKCRKIHCPAWKKWKTKHHLGQKEVLNKTAVHKENK